MLKKICGFEKTPEAKGVVQAIKGRTRGALLFQGAAAPTQPKAGAPTL